MDLTINEYEELQKLAAAAAKRVSYQWPLTVEVDDLEQDIIVFLMESPGALRRLFEEDEPTRRAFMVKIAHQMASDEQVEYDRFSGNYLYDSETVRGYLEDQLWLLNTARFRAEKADIDEAMGNLADRNSNHYAEIEDRYRYFIVHDGEAGRKRTSRAVEALTKEMNLIGARRRKDHIEGPGTRFVGAKADA